MLLEMLRKTKSHVAKLGILAIMLALVVAMAACNPTFTVKYTLQVSTGIGGTVTSPGEGLFQYPQGTVVDLVAKPDLGYRFAAWTSNANTIANAYAATTTITLDRNYYFVIASFAE